MVFRKFRRRPARKPPFRRRRAFRKKAVISKPLRPATLPLVRDITNFVNTEYAALPTGWAYGTAGTHYNTLQANQVFKLSMLDDTTEFSNLFKFYKINCVIVTITPLHSSNYANGAGTALSQTYYGANVLAYSERNVSGTSLDTAIEQSYWDQRPSKKTITLWNGRPRSFKIYPKILSELYLSAGNTVSGPKKSGWLPTTALGKEIPHFGLNMQFSWIDPNQAFRKSSDPTNASIAPMNFRVTYKYLMQFKGIK